MLPPSGLLKHRVDIARTTLTGVGTQTSTVTTVPCLVTNRTVTTMLPDGPQVRREHRARFRPGVDIARGDTITRLGETVTVQDVKHVPGPTGGVCWIEAVAW